MVKFIEARNLSAKISSFHTAQGKLNITAHLLACSAVALAAKDGRCEWLNEMYAGLTPLNQSAFKSWLSAGSEVFFGKDGKDHVWLRFMKDKGFTIVKDTMHLRPTQERIAEVAEDMSRAFFNKTASEVVRVDTGYDLDALLKQFENLSTKVENAQASGKVVVPTSFLQRIKEMSVDATKVVKLTDAEQAKKNKVTEQSETAATVVAA